MAKRNDPLHKRVRRDEAKVMRAAKKAKKAKKFGWRPEHVANEPGGLETRAALSGTRGRPHFPDWSSSDPGQSTESLTRAYGCGMIEGVREVPIATLAPGRRFQLVLSATTPPPYKRVHGTLVHVGPGSVSVVLQGSPHDRTFVTAEGQVITLSASTKEIVHWTRETPVLPMVEQDGSPAYRDITQFQTKKAQLAPGEDDMTRVAQVPGLPKGKGKPVKGAAKPKKPAAPKELHPCLCGCGERVAGRFRQGHDGRYYSLLKKVSRNEMAFNELPKAMQQALTNTAGVRKALAGHGH